MSYLIPLALWGVTFRGTVRANAVPREGIDKSTVNYVWRVIARSAEEAMRLVHNLAEFEHVTITDVNHRGELHEHSSAHFALAVDGFVLNAPLYSYRVTVVHDEPRSKNRDGSPWRVSHRMRFVSASPEDVVKRALAVHAGGNPVLEGLNLDGNVQVIVPDYAVQMRAVPIA